MTTDVYPHGERSVLRTWQWLRYRSPRPSVNRCAPSEVSSQELLSLFVARVEQHNPTVNAAVALDLDRATARALAADEALACGESLGPLHGLPMTVEDAFETAGLV